MFTPESHVSVTLREDDNRWRLNSPLTYVGQDETFVVPTGFETDFASVPRMFAWFIPTTGRYTRASILHDWLWSQARLGLIGWRDADALFRRAMREDGVAFLRRWIIWAAVRLGSLTHFRAGGAKGWSADFLVILLLFVFIGAIVVPPALVILLSLTVFLIYEAVVWVALSIGRAVKRAFGHEPEKVLVPPEVSLST